MSEAHPMWNRIKQGMLLGGIIGLNLAFMFILDWYDAVRLNQIFDMVLIGGGAGFLMGGVVSLIWHKLQAPFKRLEADLTSAAALRAKELINEQDFQTLKTRILTSYQPTAITARTILTASAWAALVGATIGLGARAVNGLDFYANNAITNVIVPMLGVGIGVGTAVAAIIQSALDGNKRNISKPTQPAMLNVATFDPLGQMQTDSDRIPAKR